MEYIPVYEDEQDEPGTVKVSLDKIQRIGVKTEKVEGRQIVRRVRAVGKVEHDELLSRPLSHSAQTASSKSCS